MTAAISECDYAQTTISRFAIEMKCVYVLAAAAAIVAVQVFLFSKSNTKQNQTWLL